MLFRLQQYLPELKGIEEDIPYKDFENRFGSLDDARFQKELRKLKARVKELPGFQTPAADEKR